MPSAVLVRAGIWLNSLTNRVVSNFIDAPSKVGWLSVPPNRVSAKDKLTLATNRATFDLQEEPMNQRVISQLPPALLDTLRSGCPALLLTVGTDGYPHTAYTWVVALDPTTLRFAADHGSATMANLEREPAAALQIISPGNLVFLIKGITRPVKPQIEAAPFKVALMALTVREVKDQSWPGVTVQPLGYHWPPEQQEAMQAIEQAVYEEMRTWPG
jgi:hypothetical protein